MIQKLKTQFVNSYYCLIISLCLPLIGFFLYATFVDRSFFVHIAIGLLGCIVVLLPIRSRLKKKDADIELSFLNLSEQINLLESDIEKEETAIKSFREKIVSFSQLKGMTERLSMSVSLDETTKTLSKEVNKLFGAEDSTIILYLFHSKTGDLGISSSHKGQMRINLRSKRGDIFDQWVVRTMQPLLIEDTKSDYRFDIDKYGSEEVRPIRSLISVPLIVGNKALGILRVDSPNEDYYSTEDLRFLQTIADVGALTIENAQLYERIEQLAIRDGLTNLYLRRHLMERLKEELSRQLRRKGKLSFMLIDIDNFKDYNDTFGHSAGDIVLKAIGKLLQSFFDQPGSMVCRYGGEEFCVMLPALNQKKTVELANELRKRIADTTIMLRRKKTHVRVSIGVASFPEGAKTQDELIHKADQALYKAKKEGRNRVRII